MNFINAKTIINIILIKIKNKKNFILNFVSYKLKYFQVLNINFLNFFLNLELINLI
jgi:hypothetical protein